jgi:NAD(P)-dependent dehydrogenase (short-subunit alcohol dehydrogenase family)
MKPSVLVTGASTGLGLEAAVYLAERGFEVYAGLRDLSRRSQLDAEAARRQVQLRVLQLDITNPAHIQAAVQAMLERSGHIYGVINNAGLGLRGYFEDLSEEEIRRVFEVNVFGTMAVTQAVLPHMRAARRGRIIIMSSIAGKIGGMSVSAYCATRHALEGFGESLAQEVRPLGLHVVLIEPGIIKTEHFTSPNRGVAERALDPGSPYYEWFRQAEKLADQLVETAPDKPSDVAKAIYQALTAKRPRMRYMIARRGSLVLALRRCLPEVLFDRFYFDMVIRQVTQPEGNLSGENQAHVKSAESSATSAAKEWPRGGGP